MAEQTIDQFSGFSTDDYQNVFLDGLYLPREGAQPSLTEFIKAWHSLHRLTVPLIGGRIYLDDSDDADEFSITALSYYYKGSLVTMSASLNNALSGGDVMHYIYVAAATGTLTVNTTGWPTTPHIPLATITLSSGAWDFSSLVDYRKRAVFNVAAEPLHGTLDLEAFTADDTLTAAETGKLCTNEGATGTVVLTLPDAAAGLVFDFAVHAVQTLQVKAASGDVIRDAGSESAGDNYIEADAKGDTLRLVALNASEWFVVAKQGTWTLSTS